MIRKMATVLVLLLLLCSTTVPALAAGGNGGSSGSDGAGSDGSGGAGNGGESAGNAGTSSPGPEGPQAQELQEEQVRQQQETVDQPGIQITQQDRDQDQGRTGVGTADESASADLIRQRDRDTFIQQISLQEQNLSRDQDRDQDQVQADLALYALSISGNVTGSAGPELTRLGAEINNSSAAALQAEQRIATRSSFSRILFGGDQEAAGLLIRYADQNQQRIQEMEQLLMNCSDCDPQVRLMLEEQVKVLSREQNRLAVLGQQEQAERGLFGRLFG